MQKIELLLIDPQYDFCDPSGALYVPGAEKDITRIAAMVRRLRDKINGIHVTLDSHLDIDIAHPIWFKDSKGNHPSPFTIITAAEVESGAWTTTIPGFLKRTIEYLKKLESMKRYPHCIWPPHCLISSNGAKVVDELFQAMSDWTKRRMRFIDFVAKGSNPFTEHFSGVQAEVPDATDPSTQLNMRLIGLLQSADKIVIAGEALSHCVANTVRDIANNFGDDNIKKMVLLTDGASSVPGFEKFGTDFISEMTARGMELSTTTDFLL